MELFLKHSTFNMNWSFVPAGHFEGICFNFHPNRFSVDWKKISRLLDMGMALLPLFMSWVEL